MSNFNWPINPTTFNSGPIQIEIDGVPLVVNEDKVDPSQSVPLPVKPIGRIVGYEFIDAVVNPINQLSYVELMAATPYATEIEIFNDTGGPLFLAVGPVAAEVITLVIGATGLTRQAIAFVAGTRLSVTAVQNTTLDTGIVGINLFS